MMSSDQARRAAAPAQAYAHDMAAAQVTLIEDDDVIETLAADRADDSLDVALSRC